jgi:ERCC4-type nuclease
VHFGTVKDIINADVSELKEVKGVGEQTAKNIRRVLDEKFYLAEKEEISEKKKDSRQRGNSAVAEKNRR